MYPADIAAPVDVMGSKPKQYPFLNYDPFPYTTANLDMSMPGLDDDDALEPSPPLLKRTLSKEEKRAEHNAIERARRESLNSKFQQLAQALPNLVNYRRPSKSQIVEKALDWIKKSVSREERYRYQMYHLQKENRRLLSQLMVQSPSTTSASTCSTGTIMSQPSFSTPTTSSQPRIPVSSQPIYFDQPSPSPAWLSGSSQELNVTTPMQPSASTPHIANTKDTDPGLFACSPTSAYFYSLDNMVVTQRPLTASPEFVQPMMSRSTPSFSTRR
ncbi:hypothetical protein BC940DRAFT_287813 [Gongronella butleri]|nr:hypothetical protein BC940DRAFT_287813 [Gongronella butleri]